MYSVKTVSRNRAWKSDLTLFEADSKNSPNSSRMHSGYAGALLSEALNKKDAKEKSEMVSAAMNELQRAKEIYPGNSEVYLNYAKAYTLLSDTARTIESYELADRYDPGKSEIIHNIGYYSGLAGQYEKAIYHIRRSLELNPRNAIACNNLGRFYSMTGKNDSAIFFLQKATDMIP